MGLDLMLHAVNKRTGEDVELSYGRKTWELAQMFPGAIYAMGADVLVTEEVYRNVIATLSHFSLDEYSDVIADFESETLSPKVIEFVEWYDSTFDESPTLGYDYAANVFRGWLLDYYEKGIFYLNDQEWQMYISASY